ncbi:hypothetical protein Gogos_013292 [Gossypium gossypioides]|uniref:Uncharacterized protein n=1 Tax=Gossypium gossypioides TaxID=34282 RepID=A0A7J9BV48_GOSGO|nr:hypothetical protein [Gossypium gossypioides]
MMGSISVDTSSIQYDGLARLNPRVARACAASFVFRGVYSKDKASPLTTRSQKPISSPNMTACRYAFTSAVVGSPVLPSG